ncbi:SDR family NAD(P)-dependent oxidoreductase [Micromonospora marina]|uniref:Enediyne polyketide synthase n=1 Tax=Micromonospora marina TaxID=307120 RepID=A0A1C5AFU5_9ACTN|nr:type I polyketide synthase [Micromonospora marina]SCF43894.1 enediyne polyketide synthase [Micromonospora marina]
MSRIAVVGMSCRYPEADSVADLWRNVLSGRRAFRRLPPERMSLEDYWDADPAAPDRFYNRNAAVIEGYTFDRIRHRIAGSTYRSTDLTHWLALDVAGEALADAGWPDGAGLPRERTAVVVGNTLTGEFSRANVLRLRWPYVRRVLAAGLREQGWSDERIAEFLAVTEERYKSPFPPIDEDTLAGGLSNTIGGRICNHFDLGGGGWTVDAACASSLLSVVTAARALAVGEIDVAVAGGVDLSIDPFEMVGFAKAGALARDEMRVYDERSQGFWPGEGCGMVVLMRHDDAVAQGRTVYASIAGWGVSSDGRGGMTRPEAQGYRLALDRAYQRAGFGIGTVPLFEGHGTGTAVGDATELRALSAARRDAGATDPAAIGSIKALIGHTKAAAGVAGLIKATMALRHAIVPPTANCTRPRPELTAADRTLRAAPVAEPWPDGAPLRAGVIAMGFGGINTHLVLEAGPSAVPERIRRQQLRLARHAQDAELLLLDAADPAALRERVATLLPPLARLSYGELTDLAGALAGEVRDRPMRLAVVAASPAEAADRFGRALAALDRGEEELFADGLALRRTLRPARLGFLFPGQGSGRRVDGGALARRFPAAAEVHRRAALPAGADPVATEVAQPRIAADSLAGLRVLTELGVEARVAVGHSLGEITALHWAGTVDAEAVLRIAAARGAVMAGCREPGTMAGLAADDTATARLIGAEPVVVAGYNGPRQTVVAGPSDAVRRVCERATEAGVHWADLAVSHAFHSPLMASAAREFGDWLEGVRLAPPRRPVVSTVTGAELSSGTDLMALLRRQITEPVRFAEAVTEAGKRVDALVEVGPGQVLARMARDLVDVPVFATGTDAPTLAGFLGTVGALWALGAPVDHGTLVSDRPVRPLDLTARQRFFASPCEAAPPVVVDAASPAVAARPADAGRPATGSERQPAADPLAVLRRLAASRAELPAESVGADIRLLDGLHLSSIAVGQLVNEAARELGLPAVQAPTNFATATLREIADALRELDPATPAVDRRVDGVAPWVRGFTIELVEEPVERIPAGPAGPGDWRLYAPAGHPYAEALRDALAGAGVGAGVLLCPDEDEEVDVDLALRAVQAAVAQRPGNRLVVVQHGRGVSGLARTARLEGTNLHVTLVEAAPFDDLVQRVVREVAATDGYAESHHDADGTRRVPLLRPLPPPGPVHGGPAGPQLRPDDVLLVTGGGKGITAECALALARDTGARLALLGRADPAGDPELAANLARMREAGVRLRYVRADVTDPEAVRAAVAQVREHLGPVAGVLHGAGVNRPAALAALDPDTLRATLGPKVDGLANILAAVEADGLRLLVTFGSVIGRGGLPGEAHYALANDWLARLTAETGRRYPGCRAVCLEWSVWSGVGMGERLSAVESLLRAGITPIPPDEGVRALRQVLALSRLPAAVVVTGRTEGLDTLRHERRELPLLRFLERPLVQYDGVELVVEADLSAESDPYLTEHDLDGNLLLPAVLGMEAMAQVATALSGATGVPVLTGVSFPRPVVVARGGRVTVRIAAVQAEAGVVEVAIRSDETGFAADHFRGTVRFEPDEGDREAPGVTGGLPPVPLEPGRDLYGDLLFQGDRFRRLVRYHRVASRRAEADVATTEDLRWFHAFLPQRLLLGDAGARDAFLHGIQVCVPDSTLLPVSVDRVEPAGPKLAATEQIRFVAVEREHRDDTYRYDVTVLGAAGVVVERWLGLRLRAVRHRPAALPWPPALLGPVLERRLGQLLGADLAVVVEPRPDRTDGPRREVTAVAVGRAVGRPVRLRYRPDGRPEDVNGRHVSAAHSGAASLLVAGAGPLACDLEVVRPRPAEVWTDLLGRHAGLAGQIAADRGEDADVAATRVWCAKECLVKAGLPVDAPLTVAGVDGEWVLLRSGRVTVATGPVRVTGEPQPVVVAVLTATGV